MTVLFPRAVINGSLVGPAGADGLPGPNAIPTIEAVTEYITSATAVRDAVDARLLEKLPNYDPDNYGAASGLMTNKALAIQAAIDAAYGAGGGVVQLSKSRRYNCSGLLIVRDGVYLVGTSTRQNYSPDSLSTVPGLVALDDTFQLRVGDWTTDVAPGGVSRLYVDGNNVGGDFSLTKQGLVRLAGVDVQVDRLFAVRSAGDGIVYDGLQNSTVVGGGSTFHQGVAKVIDNGMGGVSFHGGYYGTSHGGPIEFRDTVGEASLYFFGPLNNNWFGVMFESYDTADFPSPHVAHAHFKCGQNNTFYGCNFTGGADNDASAVVLVDNTDSLIATSVRFDSCVWWSYPEHDVVRVVGSQNVSFTGQQFVSDNGTDHAESVFCVDAGIPHISLEGELVRNDATPTYRAINSGLMVECYTRHEGGWINELNASQVVGVRRDTDDGHRQYVDQDGTLVWYDGTLASAVKGYLGRGTDTGVYVDGGIFDVRGGAKLSKSLDHQPAGLIYASAAETVDTATYHSLHYLWVGGTATTFTFSNAVDGREITLFLSCGATPPTITWPAAVRFAGTTAPGLTANCCNVHTFRYDGTFSKWIETSRTLAVPIT